MGFFRKHKAKDFSVTQAKRMEQNSRKNIWNVLKHHNYNTDEFIGALKRWGEARELLARKENENQSDVR